MALTIEVVQLLNILANQHENIVVIVQYDGIAGILNALRDTAPYHIHKESTTMDRSLVFNSVQLLENIFISSEEYGGVAWVLGAEKVLDKIQRHKGYKKDAEMQDAVRSALLQLAMSSRKKKLSVAERAEGAAKVAASEKKKAAQQRMADRKKKVAEVGKAQQAKMMKMMSLRASTKPGSAEDDAAEIQEEAAKEKKGGLMSNLKKFGGSMSSLARKKSRDISAMATTTTKTSAFESANPGAAAVPEKKGAKGLMGFGKKKKEGG